MKIRCGSYSFLIIFLFVILLPQCSTSTIVINRAELNNVKTVAIMRFDTAPGIPESIARACEESFRGHFINSNFNVVERQKLNSIIEEMGIAQSGITGDSIRLGKILGAEALLFGEIVKNQEEIRRVQYYEHVKIPFSRKIIRVEKSKRMKFFSFQFYVRLVSTATGNTILTLKNRYPERDYEMTNRISLDNYRDMILDQMGRDLKNAVDEK